MGVVKVHICLFILGLFFVYGHLTSSVVVHNDCRVAFKDLEEGKMYRYVLFAFNSELTEIQPIKKGPPESTYADFVKDLKDAEAKGHGRYGVFDFYVMADGQEQERVVMVFWNPDTASIQQKMAYSRNKDAFKTKIEFSEKNYEANDDDDLKYKNFYNFAIRR